MKQAEKIWKRRWRTVCGIILLQVFLCPLFATNLQLKDGGILIVNANSDLSPLCNHIISELIHSLPGRIQRYGNFTREPEFGTGV